jgi:hypothetical protein
MARVEKLGGNWVIVRGGNVNGPAEGNNSRTPHGTESSPTREFWTGDGWATQYGFGKQFLTQHEAEAEFAEQRPEMG